MNVGASLTTRLFLRAAVALLAVVTVVVTAMTAQHLRGEQLHADLEMGRVGGEIRVEFSNFERASRRLPPGGTLRPEARAALAKVAAGLERLLDPRHAHRPAAIDAARAAVARLDGRLAVAPDAAQIAALRDDIERADQLVEAVVAECTGHFTQAVERFIETGREARAVVGSVLSVVLIVVLALAFHTVRRFVEPLRRAVALARRIGSGMALDDFHVESRADTGNLLATMREMQANLLRYRQQADAQRALLEQRVAELAASRASLDEAQRLAKIGTWRWEPLSGAVHWSSQLREMLGVAAGVPAPGLRAFLRVVPREERAALLDELRLLRHGPVERVCEHRALVSDEAPRIVLHRVRAESDAEGRVARIYATVQDISERRRASAEIRRLARYDALTRLPNRVLLAEQLARTLAGSGRVAVLFVNIDRFRRINASLGHGAGDRVLTAFAQRMVDTARQVVAASHAPQRDALVARFGGDEFAVVLGALDAPHEVSALATRLIGALTAPLPIDGQEIVIAVYVGIAVGPDDSGDAQALIGHAATACAQARESALNSFRFFTAEMNAATAAKLRTENDLRHALAAGDPFFLLYQPKVDLASGRLVGVEALVRWRHPTRGILGPDAFIGIAEEFGLINEISSRVVRQACAQLARWQADGQPPLCVAVNFSAACFRQPDLAADLARVCVHHGVAPRQLLVEITETVLMENAAGILPRLDALHQAGFRLSVDDFGTGYSSLAYLHRFPIDELKIDRSFIRQIADHAGGRAIVAAILALGHNLGMDVVAEGVETEAQARILRELGCARAQGYLFARPLGAEAIGEMLRMGWYVEVARVLRVA